MPSPNDCWGIEVGANALKAIRLQRAGKTVAMTDFEIIPYKKVLTTPDIDREEAIRVALNQFTAKKSLDKATVVVSVPGHSAFARFAKLPPVEPKKVPDIVKFEAVQQIPFPIDQVEWDYQTFQDPDSPDVEVGIFAITRERAMNWLANFRAVGIPVHGVSLAPVASYNALAHDQEMGPDSPGTLIMDIGTSATDLIIVEGSRLWLRTIPIGGHHFTEALVRSFKLSYSKAEKIKREAATSKYARQIFQAMRPVFVDLVGEVQKSLGFYQSANRDAEITRVIGLGSTFRLPGIQKFLKQQLQVDVERLQKFEQIEASSKVASQFNDNACSLAPAYGLALQGLEVERVSCNLLPLAIAKRQIWQRKQPWMVAATLMFAASAGIAYSSNIVDKGKYEANEPIRREIQNVISRAESAQRDLRAIEGGPDPRLKIENIRNTQEYRKIWPMILRDVQQALQSSQAQEALVSGDAESVAAIPRAQRRLLAVSQIEYSYSYNDELHDIRTGESSSSMGPAGRGGAGGGRGGGGGYPGAGGGGYPGSAGPGSLSPGGSGGYPGGAGGGYPGATGSDPSMGGGTSGQSPARGGASSRGGSSRGSSQSSSVDSSVRPVLEITLTGTTPYSEAYKLLDETVVRWLQQNSDRPDRPYRILSVELDNVMPADAAPETEQRTRDTRRQRGQTSGRGASPYGGGAAPGGYPGLSGGPGELGPGGPGGPGGSGPSPYGGGGANPGYPGAGGGGGYPGSVGGYPGAGGGSPGGGRSMRQSPTTQNVPEGAMEALLPKHPLAEEEKTGDWRFVIRWRVEILDPETRRQNNEETDPDEPQDMQPVADAEGRRE